MYRWSRMRAVVFDVDGTLYRSNSYVRHLRKTMIEVLAHLLGTSFEDAYHRLREVKAKVRTFSLSVEVLGIDRGTFYNLVAERVEACRYIVFSSSFVYSVLLMIVMMDFSSLSGESVFMLGVFYPFVGLVGAAASVAGFMRTIQQSEMLYDDSRFNYVLFRKFKEDGVFRRSVLTQLAYLANCRNLRSFIQGLLEHFTRRTY